jgi:undecaprenyl-diphosphatase
MLIGLLAACVATVLSVWIQHHLVTHVRPLLDPTLHLQNIHPDFDPDWHNFDSFPSDTATLFFSIVTVIFLEHRIAGGIAFIWSLVTVGITRVALGWHYPSDVAGGLLLGVTCVYLFTRIRPLRVLFERLLLRCERRMYLLHAFLFPVLADAYMLFPGLRSFYHSLERIGAYLERL